MRGLVLGLVKMGGGAPVGGVVQWGVPGGAVLRSDYGSSNGTQLVPCLGLF